MPKVKGQTHRSYTYEEKKINRITKSQFVDHFFVGEIDTKRTIARLKPKFEKELGTRLTDERLRSSLLTYQERRRDEIRQNKELMAFVDRVFDLKEVFEEDYDMTIVESLAIWLHFFDKVATRKEEMSEEARDELLMECMAELYRNWEKSVGIIDKLPQILWGQEK